MFLSKISGKRILTQFPRQTWQAGKSTENHRTKLCTFQLAIFDGTGGDAPSLPFKAWSTARTSWKSSQILGYHNTCCCTWGFHKLGVSKMVGLQWKIPLSLKWMIRGYPYFRKPAHCASHRTHHNFHSLVSFSSVFAAPLALTCQNRSSGPSSFIVWKSICLSTCVQWCLTLSKLIKSNLYNLI